MLLDVPTGFPQCFPPLSQRSYGQCTAADASCTFKKGRGKEIYKGEDGQDSLERDAGRWEVYGAGGVLRG